jgi:hypothetical protein
MRVLGVFWCSFVVHKEPWHAYGVDVTTTWCRFLAFGVWWMAESDMREFACMFLHSCIALSACWKRWKNQELRLRVISYCLIMSGLLRAHSTAHACAFPGTRTVRKPWHDSRHQYTYVWNCVHGHVHWPIHGDDFFECLNYCVECACRLSVQSLELLDVSVSICEVFLFTVWARQTWAMLHLSLSMHAWKVQVFDIFDIPCESVECSCRHIDEILNCVSMWMCWRIGVRESVSVCASV